MIIVLIKNQYTISIQFTEFISCCFASLSHERFKLLFVPYIKVNEWDVLFTFFSSFVSFC